MIAVITRPMENRAPLIVKPMSSMFALPKIAAMIGVTTPARSASTIALK